MITRSVSIRSDQGVYAIVTTDLQVDPFGKELTLTLLTGQPAVKPVELETKSDMSVEILGIYTIIVSTLIIFFTLHFIIHGVLLTLSETTCKSGILCL